MKDERLQVFRSAVDGLIESLDAVVRLARWDDAEAKPAPLVALASKLPERLGTGSRLATAKFMGTATQVTKVDAMRDVLKRLDVAYLAYRDDQAAPDAASSLESELAASSAAAASWS